jgi:hypothetical protein
MLLDKFEEMGKLVLGFVGLNLAASYLKLPFCPFLNMKSGESVADESKKRIENIILIQTFFKAYGKNLLNFISTVSQG